MISLDATTKKLQVILGGVVTTTELPFVAVYVDVTTTTYTPGEQDGTSNGGTAVDVVASPAASTQRQVKFLSIYNADTASAAVTVRYNNNATTRKLVVATLAVGYTLTYTDGDGWRVTDTTGAIAAGAISGSAGGDLTGTYPNPTIAAGAVTEAKQTLADNTTNDVTSTKHGYAPKAPADATKFMNGAATPAFALVKDSDLSTSDITTNDATTSKHGFVVKATAPAANVLNVVGIANGETSYANKTLFDGTNPAALGAVAPGTSLSAAHRDHVHANPAIDTLAAATDITTLDASTSAHGLVVKAVAPAANVLNVVGIANGETAYTNKTLFDATNPAALGTAAPGTSLSAAHRDHVHGYPYRTITANTDTGAQNNWAATLSGHTVIEWNGASDAAITGLANGVTGQVVVIKNITAAKIITFANASGSSNVGNRFVNFVTSAVTPVAPSGFISYIYDGTNWKVIGHEQGVWITPAYASGDYTASAGSWTVDSGDVQIFKYKLVGTTLMVSWALGTTSVSATPATLRIAIPGGFSAITGGAQSGPHFYNESGAAYIFGEIWIAPSSLTIIQLYPTGFGTGTSWATTTNNTATYGTMAAIEVS